MNEEQEEVQRIRSFCENKKNSYLNPFDYTLLLFKETALNSFLSKNYQKTLSTAKIMVIGFGDGSAVYSLIKYGAKPRNIYGIEIVKDYYEDLKFNIPDANLRMVDNFIMPYPNGLFDIVIQTEFLSMIKNDNARLKMASEMFRLIKKSGKIFSYDIKKSSDPNIVSIDSQQLKKLFPEASSLTSTPITLTSSIIKNFEKYPLLCQTFAKLSFLTSHYQTIIQKS